MPQLPRAVLAAALVSAGCDRGPVTSTETKAPDGELPTRARDLPVHKAVDVARIAWPPRSAIDGEALAALSPRARASVEGSRVPVLVPRDVDLAGPAELVVRPAFTALSSRGADAHAGVTVSVSATRISHSYEGIPAAEGPARVRGGLPAFVTQNELIWSVTWREHGVSYVVEVECSRPSEDPRCADSSFVTGVADDLVFVGGSFLDGGAR